MVGYTSWAKTIKKNTNSTQNKSQTHRAKQYEVTSFLSTNCELSIETCSKNVYSLGPLVYLVSRFTVCLQDDGGFNIFSNRDSWVACEEETLLEAVEQYGFGNW